MKLLLVEDDADLSLALSRALARRGHECSECADGLDALRLLQHQRFDAVILDLGIPGADGLTVLTRLRGRADHTPVLVLTARGAVGDRVAGLNAGADDYLPKPFDLDELAARLRAIVRRLHPDGAVRCGTLRWEGPASAIYSDTTPLDLGAREHALLSALIGSAGEAVTRDRLYRLVFPESSTVQIESLEVLVHRLRKKLVGSRTQLMTLRGFGYLLREQDEVPAERRAP